MSQESSSLVRKVYTTPRAGYESYQSFKTGIPVQKSLTSDPVSMKSSSSHTYLIHSGRNQT
jgi:hypothetical protein